MGDRRIEKGWDRYYEQYERREPRAEAREAVDKLAADGAPLESKTALEVAAGSLKESDYFLERGIGRVIATDRTDGAENRSMHLALKYNHDIDRFDFEKIANEDLATRLNPASLDLVASYFGLPFTHPDKFPELWHSLVDSLRPGGVLSVTLFGMHDGWHRLHSHGMAFHAREEVESLLEQFPDAEINESEYDGLVSDGSVKHWHVYRILGVKSSQTSQTP
ncbi:class I SAM-dependent methyltransferase [Candidatus Saccharibacteria bacterium]|nr:class I SAM-dependent methyltransferase [Candidatus Saccharibacteria bacterium]